MKFQLLGPVSVADDSGQLKLDGPRLKALLTYLLLHANTPVSTSELLEALWGEEQPRSGVTAVQNAVVRLRRTVGDRIVTAGSGYLVRVEPGELDLEVFRDLVERAGPAAPAEKLSLLREALALWHGKALDGVEAAAYGPREAAALEDERLTALAARIEAELDLGRNAELVPALSTLAAEHPLDERFRAQLIVALYRAGRQAAALDVYRETRRLLMDELGLEPSQSLRDLERAVLTQDPSLDWTPPPAPPVAPVPADEPTGEQLVAAGVGVGQAPERRSLRRSLVAVSSLCALGIAGIALGVTLARDESAAPSVATTVFQVTKTGAGSTTVVTKTVVHTTGAARQDTSSRRGATSAARPKPPQATSTAKPAPAPTATSPKAAARPTSTAPVTTKATTRVAVTTVKPATGTTTPSQPRVYWLADDFARPALNTDLWQTLTAGAGVEAVEQNGRLEVTVGNDASSDASGGFDRRYGTRCALTGDFDATVEYKLLDWPTQNGMRLGLGLYRSSPASLVDVERVGGGASGGQESYGASGGGYAQTQDALGALRLRRKSGWLSMYYRHADRWVSLGAVRAPGAGQLVLLFGGNDTQFGHQAARGSFDAFAATADTVRCGGAPLPPRRALG